MGSKIGWILGAALLLAVIIFIIIRLAVPLPSDPQELRENPRLLDMIEMEWPSTFAGGKPSGGGDAAGDYDRAVDIARAHKAKILAAADSREPIPADVLDVLKQVYGHVAAGASKSSGNYARAHAGAVSVSPRFAPATDMKLVVQAVMTYYRYVSEEAVDWDLAERVARDAFTLGWHLVQERGHVNVVIVGIEAQIQAMGAFSQLFGGFSDVTGRPDNASMPNEAAARSLKRYEVRLYNVHSNYFNRMQIVHAELPAAGDVFGLVEPEFVPGDHKLDPAWRVQGLLMCGVLKHTSGKRGNRRYAQKLIDRHLDNEDALMRAAAEAADAFTAEEADDYEVPLVSPNLQWPPGATEDD